MPARILSGSAFFAPACIAILWGAPPLDAHVGSPDIFLEGSAGPYALFVTIRPPLVIPGVAEVEIHARSTGIRRVSVVPTPIAGKFAPVPDIATRSKDDPQFFTAGVWMMTSGSWEVRIAVDGELGKGQLIIPVPALASRTEKMQFGLGAVLAVLTFLLIAGGVSIAGAAAREAQLEPGEQPSATHRSKALISMTSTGVLLLAILYFGNRWWVKEASNYSNIIYKPLSMQATLDTPGTLRLQLQDPGWLRRRVDDFVPDHGHLMHLYVMKLPGMENVWHLHPDMTSPGVFTHALPPMPAGTYGLYGDIVHENGLPETVVADIDLPPIAGRPLTGDDAAGSGPSFDRADPAKTTVVLPNGSRMIWVRESQPLIARKSYEFRFRVSADGRPAQDMELYMGMQGHAAFIKRDRSVFAHVHPTGSVPMASLAIAQKTSPDPHAGHDMSKMKLPPEVIFPYGLPSPGDYRIFVQVKERGQVQTGVFDANVQP